MIVGGLTSSGKYFMYVQIPVLPSGRATMVRVLLSVGRRQLRIIFLLPSHPWGLKVQIMSIFFFKHYFFFIFNFTEVLALINVKFNYILPGVYLQIGDRCLSIMSISLCINYIYNNNNTDMIKEFYDNVKMKLTSIYRGHLYLYK